MKVDRRRALRSLAQLFLASPLLRQQVLRSQGPPKIDPVLEPANIMDFAKLAQAKLDPVAWDYMAEGASDEAALRDARKAFNRIILRPRALTDVHKIDISTELFGKTLRHPIFIDPAGGKNCFYPDGENEVARGAGETGTLMISNGGIEEVVKSGQGPKNWWQFTAGGEFRTENGMLNFVERVEDSGASAISFTVDIMHVSHRERSIHNKFVRTWCNTGVPRDAQGNLIYKEGDEPWRTGGFPSLPFPTPTWDTVRRLRELTDLPIVIKGILTAEDTEMAVRSGMSGVVVSSHGARQLDHVGGTLEALPECVHAAGGKIPVLIDGGFRRGSDVLKALALGATAVGIARPYLWGLCTFGRQGVARVIKLLRTELALDMGMAGVAKISDIDRKLVRIRDYTL
ncbi:MAG TPA: alpha-hydroxy acid oxidase [Bryobacterales bacterium]|nr:alpha-hydroxy acid oxidase [Bryobacterales bacterium]